MNSDVVDLRARIVRLNDAPYSALTKLYFDETRSFAGRTFLTLEPNDPAAFGTADLVAASLLDVRFSPRAVRSLLGPEGARIAALLPDDQPLWEMRSPSEALGEAFDALCAIGGVGRVKATKVMARKRASLVPILDRVVDSVLGLEPNRFRRSVDALSKALDDNELRRRIDALHPDGYRRIPTLRLLDAVTWVAGSHSRDASKARADVGASEWQWNV